MLTRRSNVVSGPIDVAIVGAGPYGMSVAAHLLAAGRDVRVFGEPLKFWQTQTPIAMLLRSPLLGSDISGRPTLTIRDYARESEQELPSPIPVERFIEYGKWFQKRAVPDVDIRDVRTIEQANSGFRILVEDDVYFARRVVVAAGVGTFAHRPPPFGTLDADLVSHTLDHRDLGIFCGQRVTVVGGGQSALESAALLHEAGADVDVLVRSEHLRWLTSGLKSPLPPAIKTPVKKVLHSRFRVGPAFVSQLNAKPGAVRLMPAGLRGRIDRVSTRPAGASWLPKRLERVPIRTGIETVRASGARDSVHLTLSEGSEQCVNHVLLATGYKVDLSRYAFMPPQLVERVDCVNGYPRLSSRFETSLPGLHMVGAPAAWTFGPLMRFVAGSEFAGRTVARGLTR
jgi:cation diffusion facilitator CzcD-associated flavoprotein CzcO